MLGIVSLGLAIALWYRLHLLSKRLDRLQSDLEKASGEAGPVIPDPREAATPPAPSMTPETAQPRDARAAVPAEAAARTPVQVDWMVWLGGVSVALAGVFLVKYSIDQELLTPAARVALGIVTGLAMHALAEWQGRKTASFHPALTALAGGASITLSAAILAALHLYQLIGPGVAFASLAVVSIATMVLALRHGPILAALGMLGSFAVPLLVGGDEPRMGVLLLYCAFISATVMLMVRYAYRPWLWWLMVVAALAWHLAVLGEPSADRLRGLYLAALAAALIFVPSLDWRPRLSAIAGRTLTLGPQWQSSWQAGSGVLAAGTPPTRWALALIIVAQGVAIIIEPFSLGSAFGWTPLILMLYRACRYFPRYSPLVWLLLAVQAAAWLGTGFAFEQSQLSWRPSLLAWTQEMAYYALWTSFVHVMMSIRLFRSGGSRGLWASTGVSAPLCWLALAFFLSTDHSPSWTWAMVGVAAGCFYAAIAWICQRRASELLSTWAILGCSGAYSLAAAMLLSEAGLTVALALQAVPLAWFAARRRVANLAWLTKAVLVATVLRLSLNPWLETYALGTHWALWTYTGSTLACFLASWAARRQPPLQRWTEAIGVQLLVLTLWAVPRSWMYAGNVLAEEYGLAEAAMNTAVWAALGLVYYQRSRISEFLGAVHLWSARVLLTMSLVNYAAVLTVLNPLGHEGWVSSTPIWNLLLLAYGAPAALAWAAMRFAEPRAIRVAGPVAAVAVFAFVTIEIRHLWQGALELATHPSDGEMATYSVVWLCLAVGAVLAGGMRFGTGVYRAGMVLLALTAAKVFLVDMAGLSGLLRAGAFMGLGMSLLGLAYIHQRFGASRAAAMRR